MNGRDKDLAAHFTVIRHRGKTLFGKEIADVFSTVGKEEYLDSLWCDIEGAITDILDNPAYAVLNMCRVLAYVKDSLILSKEDGGRWGLANVPKKFRELVSAATEEYRNGVKMSLDAALAQEYADYMLGQIRNACGRMNKQDNGR